MKSKSQKRRIAIQKQARQTVFRSTKTGRFVSTKFAASHKTTVKKGTV